MRAVTGCVVVTWKCWKGSTGMMDLMSTGLLQWNFVRNSASSMYIDHSDLMSLFGSLLSLDDFVRMRRMWLSLNNYVTFWLAVSFRTWLDLGCCSVVLVTTVIRTCYVSMTTDGAWLPVQLLKCNRTQANAVPPPPIYGSKRSPTSDCYNARKTHKTTGLTGGQNPNAQCSHL